MRKWLSILALVASIIIGVSAAPFVFVGQVSSQADDSDPYWTNVVLLAHMNGTDGSTVFTDSSSSAKTITEFGDAQIDTSEYKFGGASGLFDGTGDYLTVADSPDWDFGSSDFTLEFLVKTTQSNQYATLFCRTTGAFLAGSWSVLFNTVAGNGFVAVYVREYSAGTALLTGATPIRDDVWHHVAWVRSGTNHYLFIDGIQDSYRSASFTIADISQTLSIGRDQNFNRPFNGRIDDGRLTTGVARYTANFTPPAAQFPDQ